MLLVALCLLMCPLLMAIMAIMMKGMGGSTTTATRNRAVRSGQ